MKMYHCGTCISQSSRQLQKIDNYNINNLLKDKKTLNISNQAFFLEENHKIIKKKIK